MACYRFEVGDLEETDPRFMAAAAQAHQHHRRAYCLCREPPPEMYVACVHSRFLVKRMPNSGHRHARSCPSYEAPAALSGLGELISEAIDVRFDEGCTVLRLAFPLSRKRVPGGTASPAEVAPTVTDRSRREGLTLRALLHYVWAEAGLHRWYPAMAGKRSWYIVRKYLLRAIEDKRVRAQGLARRFYIPEVFSTGDKAAILQRRLAQFELNRGLARGAERFLLAIAELKSIEAARTGFKLMLKHVPECPFLLDEGLMERLRRQYVRELDMWAAFDDVHLVACFTFSTKASGLPSVEELCLMAVSAQWLPFASYQERLLIATLVKQERAFATCLRYNLPQGRQVPLAVLLDSAEPYALHIVAAPTTEVLARIETDSALYGYRSWIWAGTGPLPALPLARHAVVPGG